jgi:hypothetical protein
MNGEYDESYDEISEEDTVQKLSNPKKT